MASDLCLSPLEENGPHADLPAVFFYHQIDVALGRQGSRSAVTISAEALWTITTVIQNAAISAFVDGDAYAKDPCPAYCSFHYLERRRVCDVLI